MANPQVGIDVIGKLDGLEKALARIPDIGGKQAKAMAAQISKEIRAAERAALAAAKATKAASEQVADFGDKAGKTGQGAAKLAGALELVDERAAGAARTVADLADVGEVAAEASKALGVSLGTLGLAVGAVTAVVAVGYAAWRAYKAEQEEVKRKSDQLSASLATLKPIHDLAASSALELAHATGQLSDTELAYQQSLGSAKATRDQVVSSAKAQITTLQDQIDKLGMAARLMDGSYSPAAQRLADQIAEQKAVIDAASAAYDDVEASLRGVRDATEAAEAAEERAKQETLERTAAAERFTEAVRDMIAEENRAFALQREQAKEAERLAEMEEKAAERRADAEARAYARMAKLEEQRTAQLEQGLQDRYDLTVEYAASTVDAAAPFIEAFGAIVDAQLSAREDALDAVRSQISELDALLADLSDSTVDAAGLSGQALVDAYKAGQVAAEDLSEAQRAALERQLAAEREALAQKEAVERAAAEQAFETQQAAAIAATIVAGLQAAIAAYQLGPVAGSIAAAGIAALTATNIGLIASTKPQFHAGGVMPDGYPDETNSRTLPGEGWLNRQTVNALGGPQAVNAMNAKPGLLPGGGTAVLRIGRFEAREIVRTDVRSNGIIPQALRATTRALGRGAGLSGKGVLA